MRHTTVLLLLLLLVMPALADEEKPAKKPLAKPLTAEQAADEFLAAHKAEDATEMRRLATREQPDPWEVVQVLLARGAEEVAFSLGDVLTVPGKDGHLIERYINSFEDFDRATWERVVRVEELLGEGAYRAALAALEDVRSEDRVLTARLEHARGRALQRLARRRDALEALWAAGQAADGVGWTERRRGLSAEIDALIGAWADPRQRALALLRIGRLHLTRGQEEYYQEDFPRAASMLRQAAQLLEQHGERTSLADALEALYGALFGLKGITKSSVAGDECLWKQLVWVRHLEKALSIRRELGDAAGEARVLTAIAKSFNYVGDARRTLAFLEPAIALHGQLRNRKALLELLPMAFQNSNQLGERAKQAHTAARMEAVLEQVLRAEEPLDARGRIRVLRTLSEMYEALEDYSAAIRCTQRILDLYLELRYSITDGIAGNMLRIGDLHRRNGDLDEALAAYRRIRPIFQDGSADLARRIADVHDARGEYEKGIEVREAYLAKLRRAGSSDTARPGHKELLMGLALEYANIRQFDVARMALRPLRESRGGGGEYVALALARIHLLENNLGPALRDARKALDLLRRWAGEAVEGASSYWNPWMAAESIEIGTLASRWLARPSSAHHFLECGRANTLSTYLSSRNRIRSAQVPEALRRVEAEVRKEEVLAIARLREAKQRPRRSRTAEVRLNKEVEAARESVRRVADAIQRTRSEEVERAQVLSLRGLQALLQPNEAFVTYAVFPQETVALVVGEEDARILRLADSKDVLAACEAFQIDAEGDEYRKAGEKLYRLLVKSLELGKDVDRVLISPDGVLGYVPFSLLFWGRDVVCVPSGTVYGLLKKQASEPGEAVLALGDPDYKTHADPDAVKAWRPRSGGMLTPLPATAVEVKAVGDVVLTGMKASELSLREAIGARPKWRAVHFACHGLIDAERPMFSSLALTPTPADDGFLSVVDVIGMKIDADLAVLSACETGRGTVMSQEGILGLTRGFIIAGSPRVLVSLWKVDDEATRALMVKFYELWNPKDGSNGIGAAAALRKAQDFVRDQEKWSHPRYWAAWVLWGLPE